MSGLDAVDYQNGQKNNWRKQCWNTVTQLLCKRKNRTPKDALVLYLPGSTNLDEEVALAKGYRRENMIAVERDPKVAKFIRNKLKVNCIQADLIDVLMSWPLSSPRVDVVIADFQCGMLQVVQDTLAAYIASPQITHSVLCINAMRGRDPGEFLDWTKAYDVNSATEKPDNYWVDVRKLSPRDDENTHRGSLIGRGFLGMLTLNGALQAMSKETLNEEARLWAKCFQVYEDTYARTRNEQAARAAFDSMNRKTDKEIGDWKDIRMPEAIALPGYKSGPRKPFMDAVVLKTYSDFVPEIWEAARLIRIELEKEKIFDQNPNFRSTRRKIAAALAHRTMRLHV